MGEATDSHELPQETRRAERRQADQPSTLRGSGSSPHDSWVHDVSSTGMRIECRAELTIGEEISVGLAGAGVTRARVVWKRDNEYGCEFFEPLSAKAASSAFNGSPVVSLQAAKTKPAPAPAPAEEADPMADVRRLVDDQPVSGRWWFAGLGAAMLAVAIPAAGFLAHLAK